MSGNGIALILLISMSSTSHAVTLAEETDFSATQFNQNISADGDFGTPAKIEEDDDDPDLPFNWNINYSFLKTTTPNEGGPDVIDKTSTYTAGLNWTTDSEFTLGAKLNSASTPDENLVVRGGQLTAGYRWSYAKAGKDYFEPYVGFRVTAASNDYVETFSGQTRRKKGVAKPLKGTSQLTQGMVGFDLTWKPVKSWLFGVGFDQFNYNRDVASFESQLDSPAALQRGISGFASTVGGVALKSYSVSVAWNIAHDWRAYVSEQYSILAADLSASTTFRGTISDQFTKRWRATAGLMREKSTVISDTLIVVGLECEI